MDGLENGVYAYDSQTGAHLAGRKEREMQLEKEKGKVLRYELTGASYNGGTPWKKKIKMKKNWGDLGCTSFCRPDLFQPYTITASIRGKQSNVETGRKLAQYEEKTWERGGSDTSILEMVPHLVKKNGEKENLTKGQIRLLSAS